EEHQAFEHEFIKLRGMARQLQPVGGKHHGPGNIACPAPQLTVDEVADAPCTEAKWRQRRDEVQHGGDRFATAAREQHHCEHYADEAAVEGHATIPDADDHRWIGEEAVEVI